jgi:hypothetical protein
MPNDARPGDKHLGATDGESTDDHLPTRAEIFERADHAFHSVAQTFLSEFKGEIELYPDDDCARQQDATTDPHVYKTDDGREVAVDGGALCDIKFCGQPATTTVTRDQGAVSETIHYCDTHGSHLEIDV